MEKLIDFLPALSLLVAFSLVLIIVTLHSGKTIFEKECKLEIVLLCLAALLFVTLLIVHLFKEQPWIESVLQVIVGVLFGMAITSISFRNYVNSGSVDIFGLVNGDVAGRDMIKTIQNIDKCVSNIKDSVVHQDNKINQITDRLFNVDVLFFFLERGKILENGLSPTLRILNEKGWLFRHFCLDQNRDYIVMVLVRPAQSAPQVFVRKSFHDKDGGEFADDDFVT